MIKFKFKKNRDFRELHLPKLHLRKKFLTDAQVEQLKKLYPDHFEKYFEVVKPAKT